MPQITIIEQKKMQKVPEGTTLMDALRTMGAAIDAPCGGRGQCGKCQVLIQEQNASGNEWKRVTACQYPILKDLFVSLIPAGQNLILETGSGSIHILEPVVRGILAKIPRCPIGEASSDCRRVIHALGPDTVIPLSVSKNLLSRLEAIKYDGYFILCENTLADIRPEPVPHYVLAYDIGTTTVVSYLLDAETGQTLAVSSTLNPQTAYGADVISRSEYAEKDLDQTLTKIIRSALNELAVKNAGKAGISLQDIYFAAIVGNTCMHHLYLGVSPSSLLRAPYNATVDQMQYLTPSESGLRIHPQGKVCVLPVIAGYVGADTIGVLLSLPKDTFARLTLMLDIGTNGELVLGQGSRLLTCSTAAGPAFEGAKITYGMRGAPGAVDHVSLHPEQKRLLLSVIGDTAPAGICGSGLIDLIFCLLKLGILSSKGRLLSPDRWRPEVRHLYEHRLIRRDGILVFLLTDDPKGVCLTQKDIREVQLAKASIAAGIRILCEQMDVSVSDIQSVLLAGAFGSFMSPESACGIGLIPDVLNTRIHAIGNAAGEGAKAAALDRTVLARSQTLPETIEFVELAASAHFQDTYLNMLDFPEVPRS